MFKVRAGLAVLAATFAASLTACGSDDSDGSASQATAGPGNASEIRSEDYGIKTPDPALRSGSDEDQIRYVIEDLQSDFIVGDGDGYCSNLTAVSRKQIADVARSYQHGKTCQDFVTATSKLTRKVNPKQKPTVVLSVKVDGDRATATVSDGGRDPAPVKFVNQDGSWKVLDRTFKTNLGIG